ncbi:serine/arginine-rich splicing factor 4-like isoform X2 [Venturia canescens]|uniref:serine/arginine-rich splicing factor 4-like isoform X2 n=1 Tax=Venturia canescens TaxID=32260 RepID=UPI001C9C23EE|nr:serine/arginine-rich splicing factor 4-like isoform X2 [Venturia canescens]
MFENRKCIGHAVGGAVVGVAVGMAIQKFLSPNSSQRVTPTAEKSRSRGCGCGKKRSKSEHLEIPKNQEKHKNRRSCSKSPCEKPKSLQPMTCHSRASLNSSDQSSSKSESKYSSTCSQKMSHCSKYGEKVKTEKSPKVLIDRCSNSEESSKFSSNISTDYLPLKWEKHQDSSPTCSVSRNKSEKSSHTKSLESKHFSKIITPVKVSENSDSESRKISTLNVEKSESAIATRGSFDHEQSSDFTRTMATVDGPEFLTLPNFDEPEVATSTKYVKTL